MLYITISETLKLTGAMKDLSNEDLSDDGSGAFSMFKRDGVWQTPLVDFIGRYDDTIEDTCNDIDDDCNENCGPYIDDRYSKMAERNNVFLKNESDSCYPILNMEPESRGEDIQEALSPITPHERLNYWEGSRQEIRSIRRANGRDCHGPTRNTPEDFEAPKENFPSYKGKFTSWKCSRRTQYHPTA